MSADFRNFYIRSRNHPNFNDYTIIVEKPIQTIVQKIEMCLFTNKGDIISDHNFGCDIPLYLWATSVSTDFIKKEITKQFNTYIEELKETNFSITLNVVEGSLRDMLYIRITVNEYEIDAVFR